MIGGETIFQVVTITILSVVGLFAIDARGQGIRPVDAMLRRLRVVKRE